MKAQKRWFLFLGEKVVSFLEYLGETMVLLWQTLFWMFKSPLNWKRTFEQMYRIGVASLPIVSLTAFFTGMVLALQSAYQMQKVSAQVYIGSLVSLSMTRELGPVLTALVVAGRVGAAITAEIGTMKVTEQVDALEALATSPIKYLVVPRLLALFFMLPVLTIYSDYVGIVGGYLIAVFKLNISSALYLKATYDPLKFKDVFTGLLKSQVFALIICIVACYEGFRTRGGAEGVGRATTSSVVTSFIMIVTADCLVTAIFYFTPFFR
jgi:phospholipid/cholesterol/gamma-HCH transport system permease protein